MPSEGRRTKKRTLLCIITILLTGGAVLIMGFMGLFDKKYVIGENVPINTIDSVYLYSSGPAAEDCWHYTLERENERYLVKTVLYMPSDGNAPARQSNVCEEITREEFRAVLKRFAGYVCSKDRKGGKEQTADGRISGVVFGWEGAPEGYRPAMPYEALADVKEMISLIMTHPSGRDIGLLCEVSFGYAGDSIGSSSETTLFYEKGQWYVRTVSCAGAGQKTVTRQTAVEKEVPETVREIISSYAWEEMEDLPASELFACDAPVCSIRFGFEPSGSWHISDTMELTEEAREMWSRIRDTVEGSVGR